MAAGHEHASTRFYVAIAVILAVLTALEVMVFFIEALRPVLTPLLLIMMAAKFFLVAAFFMHLRFDGRLLNVVFAWGLVVATGITLALMAVFGRFS
ncbi:MAG: cytochrome C oxidase subunit IV family protein [Gemmatimonadetes bacterium]|nr:cytochrome C oxidase subunit IV family protein [Gemmatimonadota bacterium]